MNGFVAKVGVMVQQPAHLHTGFVDVRQGAFYELLCSFESLVIGGIRP